MTPAEIRAAIAASPALQALNNDVEALAEALSAKTRVQRPCMISERGIMERYPGGPLAADAVLVKLETFANSGAPGSGPVKRAMKFLASADGLDIGSDATRAQLEALAAGGVITQGECDALRGLALVSVTVTPRQVADALQGA
jgi:hypothetical protein